MGQALLDIDSLSLDDAVRSMATASSADREIAEVQAELRETRDALGSGQGPIVFRQAVVAYRVAAFDRAEAQVAIWHVDVLARDGIAPPQAGWAISTFDLVWERNDWRISFESIVPGPAPLLNNSAPPSTTTQFETALGGFVDFGAHS